MHCEQSLSADGPLFCPHCLQHISLIETQGRCRTCFSELSKGRCDRCIHRHVVIHHQLAAVEAQGPARALLQEVHKGHKDGIAAAASLMAYQWLQQKHLLPEFLIPMPTSFWQKQKVGLDPELLLAKKLGELFSVPVISVLRKRFDRSHFLETGEFRHQIVSKKQAEALCDRRILLIATQCEDDLFRSAGRELKAFFPTQIDALAFGA